VQRPLGGRASPPPWLARRLPEPAWRAPPRRAARWPSGAGRGEPRRSYERRREQLGLHLAKAPDSVRRLTRHRDRWFGAATSVSTIGWSCVTLEGQNQPREYSCQSATPHRYGSPLEFCEWLARLAPREASRPPGSPARTPHQDPRATPADGLPLAIAPHPAAEPSAGRSSAIPVAGTERGCRCAEYCRPPACNGESAAPRWVATADHFARSAWRARSDRPYQQDSRVSRLLTRGRVRESRAHVTTSGLPVPTARETCLPRAAESMDDRRRASNSSVHQARIQPTHEVLHAHGMGTITSADGHSWPTICTAPWGDFRSGAPCWSEVMTAATTTYLALEPA
jgi:hypothetical protein